MPDDDDDAAADPKLKALFQQLKSAPVSTEEVSLECTHLLARLRQIPEAVRSEQTAVALEDFSALPFQQIGQYELLERIAGGGMGGSLQGSAAEARQFRRNQIAVSRSSD